MATVTRSPGTIVEGNVFGYGTYHWSNIGNVVSSNNIYATVTASGPINAYVYTPVCTNFGFSIPAGASIDGIKVLVECKVDHGSSDVDWTSIMLSGSPTLMHANGWTAADTDPDFPMGATDVVYTMQPAADPLWGRTWTPADINDATFGCAFDCYIESLATISVDHVQITIDYTEDNAPENVCYSLPCDVQVNFEQAILRSISQATGGFWEGCTGLRVFPVNKICDDLTELKECGETFTLEQAFKRALILDECGNYALRIFTIPRNER